MIILQSCLEIVNVMFEIGEEKEIEKVPLLSNSTCGHCKTSAVIETTLCQMAVKSDVFHYRLMNQ